MTEKTWLITGASKGFGRLWASAALERGDRVAALLRNPAILDDLRDTYGDAILALPVDVTDRVAVGDAVKQAHAHFGVLHVVVNNAGIGLFGAVEETSEAEARQQFDTNFFGSLWVTQAAIPLLRAQGGGHIVQVSSYLGVTALPYVGLYTATKWAVEGLIQSLAAEVEQFGINTTLIEPGPFAADWSTSAPYTGELPQYDTLRQVFGSGLVWVDPVNTPTALFAAVDADVPPTRLILGSYPHSVVAADYQVRLAQWDAWAEVAASADSD
jgi:NAD(P)-dependent dehydrogenase (short-subunit alcohol dehydrogenase family)